MVISYNSQLGLRFEEPEVRLDFLTLMKDYFEKELGLTQSVLEKLADIANANSDENGKITLSVSKEERDYMTRGTDDIMAHPKQEEIRARVVDLIGLNKNIIDGDDSAFYFICDSVYKCAELIKIKQWFSGRTLKDINFGKYTYLLGKNRMIRFIVVHGAIQGFYYDSQKRIVFEWGIEMENGDYFFSHGCSEEFSTIMRLLTFVELGDIEVKMLEAGRNNGGKKNENKVTNTSKNTVYVVDSTWKTIVIRTDGFAVRGHYRLQPCGESHKDRKLIWIDAFEKHGYKRRPTGEIVR